MDGNRNDDEGDKGREGPADEVVDLSQLSPAEFARRARALKGLDPTRLTDLPDDAEAESGCSDPDASRERGARQEPSAPGSDEAGDDQLGDRPCDDEAAAGGDRVSGDGGPDGDRVSGGSHLEDPSNRDSDDARKGSDPGRAPSGGSARPAGSVSSARWLLGSVRSGPLEPGAAGVAVALAALEAPAGLDDVTLSERTMDLVRARSLLDAAIAAHASEWDRRGVWSEDGSKSPVARMARDANISRGTAGATTKLARALDRMPETARALAEGRISSDHARRLAHACTDERLALFLEAEQHLVGQAEHFAGDHQAFNIAVRHWEHITDDQLHDPTDPDDEPPGSKRARTGRDFRMSETPDGFDLTGSLPKGDGTILWTQWQHIYDQLWEADWAQARAEHGDNTCVSHLSRTVAQRRADALVEMARRASAYQPGAAVARPLVTVLVHAPDLFGPIRQTFNGTVLSRRDVAQWLSEADFERVVFDTKGQPVDITSPQRFFTGAMRRAVQIRDRVCSHPTCDVDAERCQVDHIIEHNDGGPTSLDNARLLCRCHNQQRPGRTKKPPPNRTARDDSGGDDGDDGGDDGGDGNGRDRRNEVARDQPRDTDREGDGD